MSRIGNKHIDLPAGVTVTVNGNIANVKGPKGSLDVIINKDINVAVDGTTVICTRANEEKQTRQNHGTTRANIHNAVVGVSEGFSKTLEMRGIGYKAVIKGKDVEISAGYSHTVIVKALPGVVITTPSATEIKVDGIDRQAVGQVAALIRDVRRPEPYLGKGIRYKGEYVATKEGKRASSKA